MATEVNCDALDAMVLAHLAQVSVAARRRSLCVSPARPGRSRTLPAAGHACQAKHRCAPAAKIATHRRRSATAACAEQGAAAAGPEEAVRRLLLEGQFGQAADKLSELCPPLASNAWLQFQLKRHQFMHLAAAAAGSAGSPADRQKQLQEALGE